MTDRSGSGLTASQTSPHELERVDIRTVWPGEARDFTPWLGEHLDILGAHVGLGDLSLEATEVPIPGGRALDVLAVDANGQRWAIENQYGIGDHDHLTRALAYAVALECRGVVVVAEGHRDEFIAVADEWNRNSEAFGRDGIRLFLAVVEAWRIGESASGFRFRHVAGPNEWKVNGFPADPGSPFDDLSDDFTSIWAVPEHERRTIRAPDLGESRELQFNSESTPAMRTRTRRCSNRCSSTATPLRAVRRSAGLESRRGQPGLFREGRRCGRRRMAYR
jgi:hypothetical protein